MVNEQGSSNMGQAGTESGFSAGTAVSSFAGALVALLVGGGVATLLWPQAPAMVAGTTGHTTARASQDLQVSATGVEEFLRIDGIATSVVMNFDAAGTYRVELRALDGASDPVLTLYAADSDVPFGSNDDAAGTLDSILPVRVAADGDSWRVELTSFGETSGASVLRVIPAAEGEDFGPLMTSGPGAFPSDEIATLAQSEPTVATVGQEGVWYTFKPATSGVHVLSIRASEDNFDTVASLLPVLDGQTAPLAGTDIASLGTAFTSDDDDGLNPRFARYLQAGADYYLFVRGFEAGSEGSIAISLELANADTPLVINNPMEEMHEDFEEEMEMAPVEDDAPRSSNKLNSH